jgi:hypothetical protein
VERLGDVTAALVSAYGAVSSVDEVTIDFPRSTPRLFLTSTLHTRRPG